MMDFLFSSSPLFIISDNSVLHNQVIKHDLFVYVFPMSSCLYKIFEKIIVMYSLAFNIIPFLFSCCCLSWNKQNNMHRKKIIYVDFLFTNIDKDIFFKFFCGSFKRNSVPAYTFDMACNRWSIINQKMYNMVNIVIYKLNYKNFYPWSIFKYHYNSNQFVFSFV
jgi:hypothetical protein